MCATHSTIHTYRADTTHFIYGKLQLLLAAGDTPAVQVFVKTLTGKTVALQAESVDNIRLELFDREGGWTPCNSCIRVVVVCVARQAQHARHLGLGVV